MNVEERVIEVIMEQLGVEKKDVILDAKMMDDLGADSLDVVELCMQLEEEFNITIEDVEGEEAETVGDVIKLIKDKEANKHPKSEQLNRKSDDSLDKFIKEHFKTREQKEELAHLYSLTGIAADVIGARQEKGLSQKDLAMKAKMKQQFISRVEQANGGVTIKTLTKIARALDKELIVKFI